MDLPEYGPYEYSPQVLDAIRQRVLQAEKE